MTVPDTKDLRRRVALAINESGFDNHRIAEMLAGSSHEQVSRWRNQRQTPSSEFLMQIPRVLRVNGHWLLTGEGQMRAPVEGDAQKMVAAIRRTVC